MDGVRESELQRIIREARIVTFLLARVAELERNDPLGAGLYRQAVDDCCDWVDCSSFGTLPGTNMVRGAAVRRFEPLKELASDWADHPDFEPEWSR